MEKFIFDKKVLDLDEKISLLKERGLNFLDEEKSKQKILHIGYFRLTGYLKYFQDKETEKFFDGVTFEKVMNLYNFDMKLRILSLDAIEKIEVSLKSVMNYEMYKDFGFFWYLDEEKFFMSSKNREIYENLVLKIKQIQEKSSSIFVKEFFKKYSGEYLPCFMLFEELTIGEIATIYNILKKDFQKKISQNYDIDFLDLKNWLQIIRNLRNISAHQARLWNRDFNIKISKDDKILKNFLQKDEKGVKSNFYNNSLIINFLLKKISKNFDFVEELKNLFDKFPEINKEKMGFFLNWKKNFKK